MLDLFLIYMGIFDSAQIEFVALFVFKYRINSIYMKINVLRVTLLEFIRKLKYQ